MSEQQAALLGTIGSRRRPLRGMVICLVLGMMVLTVPFVRHGGLYAIVLGLLLCLLGPLAYAWFRNRLDYFELIHVSGLVYFVYFGLGAVWIVNDPSYVAYDLYVVPYVPRAAVYCLVGYLALLIGYYGPWRGVVERRPAPDRVHGPLFLALVGGIGLVGFRAVGLVEYGVVRGEGVRPFLGTLSQLSPLFLFAWALAWLLVFAKQATPSQRWVLFGFLGPCAAYIALATFSDKSLVVELIGIPIVARWYTKRRVPWTVLCILLLVLIFVIFPFYNTYRWSDPGMGQMSRMVATFETVQSWDSDHYLRFSLRSFTRRLAMINSVAVVVRDVGRWTPYAKGGTLFMPALVSFVPRVVWPEKPVLMSGRKFGEIFRVTTTLTRDTHIAATVPGELYWNFDLPGVLVGMALIGLLMRFLYRRYCEGEGWDPVRRAVHILLLIMVAHLGGSLASTFVMLVRTLVVIELLCWLGRHFGLLEAVSEPAADAPESA